MSTRPSGKRPTINDVAALAGVSKGSVSLAFNNGGRISQATAARIHAAAAELGWVPSAAARAINGAPAATIGIVLRRPAELLRLDPFFPAFLAGVEDVLAQHGYAAILRFVDSAESERTCYRRMIAERRVDGFLITDLRATDSRIRLLRELGAPVVVIGRTSRSFPFSSVDSDSDSAVRTLIEGLIEEGHRRIAHVTGPPDLKHARHRRQLWEDTLRAHALETTSVEQGDFVAAGGAAATDRLLLLPKPPTAIFYANDLMAIAGMARISAHGLRVPEDVAVIGFDDIEIATYASPTLTTVHCDYPALGRAAAELLLLEIGGRTAPRRTLLPATAVLRTSSGPPARGSSPPVVAAQ